MGGCTGLHRRQAVRPAGEGGEPVDPARYTDAESLFGALARTVEGHHPVRLVRMSWLLRQRGSVLKRRQELPEEAFVPAEELRAVWEAGGRGGSIDKVVPIIAISFCWDAREHPDPEGLQMNLVIDTLEQERGKYSKSYGSFKGFSEMGVFWDWPSLLQGNPDKAEEAKAAALREGKSEARAQEAADEAKRTPAEKAAFKHALHETMDLWYAHQATTVFLLTQHPRERRSTREYGYDQSGWTTYERCSAEQIKQVYRWQAIWSAVADLGQGAGAPAAGRGWPVGPDEFDQLIEGKTFTNGADREAVKAIFRRMSRAQLAGVTEFDFKGMPPPTPEQAAGLGGCLRLCFRLEVLDLTRCEIGPAGAEALAGALPSMPALQKLYLGSNAFGGAGALALAGALPSAPGLELLDLGGNGIGGDGAEALAGALPSMPALRELHLESDALGGAGARALAGALPSAPALERLYLKDNVIGGDGAEALAGALPSMPALRLVALGRNGLGDAGARALAGALPSAPSLEVLHLQNNDIGGDGAEALAGALPSMSALRELYLASNALGDAGARALAGALPSAPGLQRLALHGNGIGGDGAEALAGALPSMPALRLLALGRNALGDAGAQALAGALPSTPSLEVLFLDGNGIGGVGAEALAEALPSAPALQALAFLGNDVGDGAKAALRAAWGERGAQGLEL